MHVSQVWNVGRGGASRRGLHPATQRGQRKDLRLPLVLVPDPRGPHGNGRHVPLRRDHQPKNASVPAAPQVSPHPRRRARHFGAQVQVGGLVSDLNAWRERRLAYLP